MRADYPKIVVRDNRTCNRCGRQSRCKLEHCEWADEIDEKLSKFLAGERVTSRYKVRQRGYLMNEQLKTERGRFNAFMSLEELIADAGNQMLDSAKFDAWYRWLMGLLLVAIVAVQISAWIGR